MRAYFLKIRKCFTAKRVIALLLILGCALRVWYAIKTPVTLRGHDIWQLSADAKGKAAYLLRLVEWGKLPDSYELQFYQQPFYYLLSALVAVIIRGITGITEATFLVNAGKVVSCVASCLSLFLSERLLRECCLNKKVVGYGVAILSFTPVFWLTGGRLGEDALTFLFMVAVILGTIRWEKNPDWKHTVLLAILYGCGMMTKISLAFPAFYTAYRFWKNRKIKLFIPKMGVFALISLPLGMWYSIRNYILFGQPIGYVLPQGGALDRESYSYVARFFSFDIKSWLSSPYADPFSDYNLPIYLLKTELFGEFTYDMPVWIPTIFLLVSTLLTLAVAAIGIYRICRWKTFSGDKRPLIYGLLFGAYTAISYFELPYGCSMDFRYYMMLTVCKVMVLCGFLGEKTGAETEVGSGKNREEVEVSPDEIGEKIELSPAEGFAQEKLLLQNALKVLCVLFVGISAVFYVML